MIGHCAALHHNTEMQRAQINFPGEKSNMYLRGGRRQVGKN